MNNNHASTRVIPYGAPVEMFSAPKPGEQCNLTVQENVQGCTVRWETPQRLRGRHHSEFTQTVVVHDAADRSLVEHIVVQRPKCFISFATKYGHSYDVTLSMNVGDLLIQGFLRFVAAKSLALSRRHQPRGPHILTITIDDATTSTLAKLSWKPMMNVNPRKHSLIVRIWCGRKSKPSTLEVDPMTTTFEIKTISGNEYLFEIRYVSKKSNYQNEDHKIYYYAVGDIWFKAVYTPREISVIQSLAIDFFADPHWKDTTYLYRCKPQCYFDACLENDDNIMKTYVKDFNGHAASPINGVLKGLFFYGRHFDRNTLPDSSPFGNVMWKVPIANIIEYDLDNVYFADFYCLYKTHYVTLVVARSGTVVDKFCARTLVRLDLEDNNWFRIHKKHDRTLYYLNCKFWVEIYFTDDLPLNLGTFSEIEPRYSGNSRPGGIPSNIYCDSCNPTFE